MEISCSKCTGIGRSDTVETGYFKVHLIADMENIAWDGISNPSDHYKR